MFVLPSRPRIIAARLWSLLADPGEARHGRPLMKTDLRIVHRDTDGTILSSKREGSGVVTVGFVNLMVSDAIAGTSMVTTLGRYKYADSGTGTTAATDGDTALQTQAGPSTRATATLSNHQTATTGNHAAILEWSATIVYAGALAITEAGLFDQAAQGGNLLDHRTFSARNVTTGQSLIFIWDLTLSSNG